MNSSVVCCDETVNFITKTVEKIFAFLHEYSFVIDSYILDFFVDDLWSKLPVSWQKCLENVDPVYFSAFISTNEELKSPIIWPLSLLSFRASAIALSSVSRSAVNSSKDVYSFLKRSGKDVEKFNLSSNFVTDEFWGRESELSENAGQHKGVDHILRRKVKPKKQHEIVRLSQVAKILCESTKCERVVDIGSGCGHLSRILSLHGNLSVTSLEADTSHVKTAKKLDQKVQVQVEKKTNEKINVNHIENFLPPNINNHKFLQILNKYVENEEKICLIGLHTCGDLASTLIRLFATCSPAAAMISVGCCYMKLDSCYPLSQTFKNLSKIKNYDLSYYAKEAACHAMEKYSKKLKGDLCQFKIHCYRATLESVIVKYHPEKKHLGLRGKKNAHKMEFKDYAEMSLKEIENLIPKDEFESEFVKNCLSRWKQVVAFYSLRLFLSILVETLILFDRMIYLHEQHIDSCLISLFDPNISPRNQVLLAIK